MLYIIASIIILGFVSAWLDKRYKRKLKQKIESGEIPKPQSSQTNDSECCGMHEICEKESLLAAVSKNIEYYKQRRIFGVVLCLGLHYAMMTRKFSNW